MSLVLQPIVSLYRALLTPLSLPSALVGVPLSALDLAATARLCLALRQIRDGARAAHVKEHGERGLEARSFVREAATALLVVYGGEAVVAPYLGLPPSFLLAPSIPLLYTVVQALASALPASLVPVPSATIELPLAMLDGLSRAYLVCTLVPPSVLSSAHAPVRESPWAMVLTSFVIANGGFFLTNLFSLLAPGPLALTTPPELAPYGWATADLWCAPLATAFFAFLTHAQPWWADAHGLIVGKGGEGVDPETARAACALGLALLFTGRAARNFGLLPASGEAKRAIDEKAHKEKTQ